MRDGRAVGPPLAQHIGHIDEFVATQAVGGAEGGFEGFDGFDALAEAIVRDADGFLLEVFGEPLGNGDFVGDAGFMEFDAGAGQLLSGLDEEAAVGPEAGVVLGDDKVASFASKSGEPFDLFPAGCDVFAGVGIGGGDDHRVVPQTPDLLDPTRIHCIHFCHNLQI